MIKNSPPSNTLLIHFSSSKTKLKALPMSIRCPPAVEATTRRSYHNKVYTFRFSFALHTMLIVLGLSPAALSPAAAWYFIVIVCRFFAPQGEKTAHRELNMSGERKSYCVSFSPSGAKKDTQRIENDRQM